MMGADEYKWADEPAGTVVELSGVELTYDSDNAVKALDNINLKLLEGEFVCLLGPSGCGKSTLLKIIAGFVEPTAGTAVMDGAPIRGADWHRGVAFQYPPLYPWLNVADNVQFGLKMRNIPAAERQALTTEYLKKVGLLDFSVNKT